MDVAEPLYVGEQIHIPPDLPEILKQFTKAAIKTQPDNTFLWAAQYFEALAHGALPPVQSRLALTKTKIIDTGEQGNEAIANATVDQLKALADTLGQGPDEVDRSILESASSSAGIPALHIEDALGVGGFGTTIVWKQFLFLLCASIPDNGDLLSSLAMTVGVLYGEELMPMAAVKELYLFVTGLDPTVTADDQHKKLGELEAAAAGKDGKVSKADIFGGAEAAAAAPAAEEPESAPADETPAEGEAAAAEGDAAEAPAEAPAEEEAKAAVDVGVLAATFAEGPAELEMAAATEAAVAAGYDTSLLDVVTTVGKFDGAVSTSNVLALLVANDANDFASTAAALKAVLPDADAFKAAVEFVASLDDDVSADDVAAATA